MCLRELIRSPTFDKEQNPTEIKLLIYLEKVSNSALIIFLSL